MITRRQLVALSAAASATAPLLAGRPLYAQAPVWPTRFIKLVVPFTPGGGIDGLGRIVGAAAVGEMGPAGGGREQARRRRQHRLGIRRALRARRLHHVHHGRRTRREPVSVSVDQLRPGCRLRAGLADLLFPEPSGGAEDVALQLGRRPAGRSQKNPGKVTFASPGHGSSPHMSGELFKYIAKVDLTHVPYRGAAPAFTDVIAGRVDCTFAVMASGLPLVQGGQLRALGVTTAERVEAAPDVPTIAEAGVPGYDTSSWFAFFVPAKTPPEIIQKMSRRHRRGAGGAGGQGQARSARRSCRSARRRRRSRRISRPRWTNGRPSSRPPTSRSTSSACSAAATPLRSPEERRSPAPCPLRRSCAPRGGTDPDLAEPLRAPGRAVPARRRHRRHRARRLPPSSRTSGASRWWSRTAAAAPPISAPKPVVRADPDGYTMLFQSMPLAVNRFLFPSLTYDRAHRSRAGVAALRIPQHHGGADLLAGALGHGIHRLRQRQPGQGHVRLLRSRHLGASLRRAVQAHGARSRCCTCPIAAPGPRSTI